MQELDLYKTYFYEYGGKIVTAKIIAQTPYFLYLQLSNGEKIYERYSDNIYNTKEELVKHKAELDRQAVMWTDCVEHFGE